MRTTHLLNLQTLMKPSWWNLKILLKKYKRKQIFKLKYILNVCLLQYFKF